MLQRFRALACVRAWADAHQAEPRITAVATEDVQKAVRFWLQWTDPE